MIMNTANGLHAAEIVPLQPKDLLSFETKVMQTIWGRSRPGRAKEIFFTLLCKGHMVALTLVLKYHRILWLSQLCRTKGARQIIAQAIWETTASRIGSGPYGRAMHTARECGWVATQGWWGWTVPGRQDPLLLCGDKNTVKHEVREQLRSQMLDSLVQRRPRLFAGAHYTTCRRLVQPSIATFATEPALHTEGHPLRSDLDGPSGLSTRHACHVYVPFLRQCAGRRGAHFLAVYSMAHCAGKPPAGCQDHSGTSAKPPPLEPVALMLTTLRVSPRAGPRQHQIRDSSRLFDCPTQYIRGHFTGPKVTRHTIPHALFGDQPFATPSAIPVPPAGGTPTQTG